MKLSDAFPSKWLTASDLNDQDVMAIIADAKFAVVGDERKVIITFQGGKTPEGKFIGLKPMICNKTNYKTISEIVGSDDTDNWQGREIVLITRMVDFQGDIVPGLRVRAPKARVQQPNGGQPNIPGRIPAHEVEDKGRYDTMRRTEPVKTTGDDLPSEKIPF